MNVPDQLQQICIFLTKNGFITILEKMPMAGVPAIMRDGIPGKKPSHYRRYGYSTGSEKQMEMIGHERPRIAGGIGFCQNMAKAF